MSESVDCRHKIHGGVQNYLKKVYEDISSTVSFSSPYRLWKYAKQRYPSLTLQQVQNWISTQTSYTKHRKVSYRFPRRKVIVKGINHQWQADLVELGAIQKENRGIRYLLVVIDCFTRYVYISPLKNKSAEKTSEGFEKILKKSYPGKPKYLQTDQGKEFLGKRFQQMLEKYNIKHFYTSQDVKAQIVERFNRTLKSKMFRYFTANKTLKYIDILDKLVETYNKTPHSSLGHVPPLGVTKKNEKKIFKIQYGKYLKKKAQKHKYNINDKVRISVYRKQFRKGYEKNFTDEIFTIVDKLNTIPVTYKIRDSQGIILEGSMYEPELVVVNRQID